MTTRRVTLCLLLTTAALALVVFGYWLGYRDGYMRGQFIGSQDGIVYGYRECLRVNGPLWRDK